MKKLRNFKCTKCSQVFERLTNDDVKIVNCTCEPKAEANRCLSSPKCFQNTTGRSPSAN
jgi:hypothetical protein